MRNRITKALAGAAILVLSATGLHGCSEDGALPAIPLALGTVDGPSASDMADFVGIECDDGDVDCDGEIDTGGSNASRGTVPVGLDDDLYALLHAFNHVSVQVDGVQDLLMEYTQELQDHIDEQGLGPGDPFSFGPLSGAVDLDEACRSGNGRMIITRAHTGTLEDSESSAAIRGVAADLETQYLALTFSLQNCRIEGEIDDEPGDDALVLSGTLSLSATIMQDDVDLALTGSLLLNPVAIAGAGAAGSAGTIWGENVLLTIGAFDSVTLGSIEGGACYGGTVATSNGCQGYFIDADVFAGSYFAL